mmetsp:Transcript_41726/g.110210  ORF Transcript_41726/g.110210 Transcript_41726/m.110210 type:complete len:175 (-) Transcript_41726:50-574(-)
MEVVDGLALYLEDNDCLAQLEGFLRRHCGMFPAVAGVGASHGGELSHECFAVYREYEELVTALLEDFVEESRRNVHMIGVNPQAWSVRLLATALRDERAADRRDPPGRMMRALLAITSFEEFAAQAGRGRWEQEREAEQLDLLCKADAGPGADETEAPFRYSPPARGAPAAQPT